MEKDVLKAAWSAYVTEGTVPGPEIRAAVFSSWKRCGAMGVSPWQKLPNHILGGAAFQRLREEKHGLVEQCQPYMEMLYNFVQGSGFVIALTNEAGVLLRIIGDADILERIREGGFFEGADYSEASAGTNAIGTALFLREPMQVCSYEHFCRSGQVSCCSCAPLFDHREECVGSICLVGYDYSMHSHTLGMAVAVATAVHNAYVMQERQRACVLSDSYKSTLFDCISQGVLAVDPSGQITHLNRKAVRLLQLDEAGSCVGRYLKEVLPPSNTAFFNALSQPQRYTDREIRLVTAKGPVTLAVTTRPIHTDEGFAGVVAVLYEISRMRKIMQRASGAIASTSFSDLVGQDPRYLETVRIAKNAAASDFNILLLGESGTGKDVFAQAIHNSSRRSEEPFIAINCSAIPRELIGSELFGYEEGAFTGARKGGSTGKFELADGGTIFLDEIGDMPMDLQGHLLRVIEERKVTRIGGHELIPVDVRIIAATNRNLAEDVAAGRFRQDLYYRLNVISICMVPLRERMQDLDILTRHFYDRLTVRLGLHPAPISEEYLSWLRRCSFPGNIRELQNIVERSLVLSRDGRLAPPDLSGPAPSGGQASAAPARRAASRGFSLERETLCALLNQYHGNVSQVARQLGVARSTLYRKMDQYGIYTTVLTREEP